MNLSMLELMFAYNDWANDKMVAALEHLGDTEVNRKTTETAPSLRDRFAHIVGAESIWLQRWSGENPTAAPAWAASIDLRGLAETMQANREERNRRLKETSQADLDRIGTYRNLKGDTVWVLPVGHMLLHLANHSTHHRGQIASAMRQTGNAPPQMDFLFFAVENHKLS